MKAQRGSRSIALPSVLDGVGGQHHVTATLPRGNRLSTHCTGGWVGSKAGLDG